MFSDNDSEKWGTNYITGIECVSPSSLQKEKENLTIFIVNKSHTIQIEEQLKSLGINDVLNFPHDDFLNFFDNSYELLTHITEHCNLNCAFCRHFSPLAQEEFLKIGNFEKDMRQLAKICGEKFSKLQLMGGEPLLHNNVTAFFDIARKYFPSHKINISLVSNGILLLKQKDIFWGNAAKNCIEIHISAYPIKLDLEGIRKKAKEYGVYVSFGVDFIKSNNHIKRNVFTKIPLDLTGSQDPEFNFANCPCNTCHALHCGKIYMCDTAAYIKYFNEYFNENLTITDKDFLDIYKIQSEYEILNFRKSPIPFCAYCTLKKAVPNEWRISKKQLEEWI